MRERKLILMTSRREILCLLEEKLSEQRIPFQEAYGAGQIERSLREDPETLLLVLVDVRFSPILETIRELKREKAIQVALVSASEDEPWEELQSDLADFHVKPFDSNYLMEILSREPKPTRYGFLGQLQKKVKEFLGA